MKVVQKDGLEEVFDWRRVYTSLKEETGCENKVAEEATRYIINHVLSYKLPRVTGPLIRELACIALMELGRDDLRRKYTRVGMPVFDAAKLDSGGGKGDNANLQCSPETVHKRKADRVSKEQYYLTLPEHLAHAHLSGDIHIHDLEYFGTRQFCLDSDLRYFFKYGFVGDGTGEHTSIAGPAKRAEVAILHAAKVLGASQTQCAGGQGFYNFLTFMAPFFEGREYSDYYQCMQMFCYEMTQMLVARGGQAVFSSVQLSPGVPKLWQDIPVVYKGKVWDGKEAPLRTYGEFEAENRLLFKAMMEVMLEGDSTSKPFYFPKPEINIAPEFVDLLDQTAGSMPTYRELYMLAFELASKFGTPYFDNTVPKYRQTGGVECFQCSIGPETLIQTYSDGILKLVPIKDFDGYVNTPDGISDYSSISVHEVDEELYEIVLNGGRKLVATHDHKMPVDGLGKVLVSDLKIGDKLRVCCELPTSGNLTLFKEYGDEISLAYLFGLYAAEGTTANNGSNRHIHFCFGARETDLIEKCKQLIFKCFNYSPKWNYVNSKKGIQVSIHSNEIYDWFESIGIGMKGRSMCLPPELFTARKDVKMAFLLGYYRGDGTFRKNGVASSQRRLEINTISKELAEGVLLVAGSLGFDFKYGVYKGNVKDKHVLTLNKYESIKKFFAGIVSEHLDIWVPIRKINLIDYSGPVYDIVAVEKGEVFITGQGIVSSNCAYNFKSNAENDSDFEDKLHFKNGAHFSMGAWQVMTLNLPRIASECQADTVDGRLAGFMYKAKKILDLSVDVFKEKRALMDANVRRGSVPFLSQRQCHNAHEGTLTPPLVDFDKLVWTVGVCGLNEVVKHITGFWLHEDKAAQRIGLRICLDLKKYCEALSQRHDMPIVLSRTPAETTAQRFATIDLLNWIEDGKEPTEFVCQGDLNRVIEEKLYKTTRDLPIYYTNGTHISPAAQIPITERVCIEQAFFPVLDGGNICHIWMGEMRPSAGGLMDLTLKACQSTNLGYFAFTRDMTTRTSVWRRYSP